MVLPGSPADPEPRPNASAECWALYGEVAGYEAEHVAVLGRFHQLMVDAYVAQHAASTGPAIGTPFALIGLRLALDEGWRGDQVRDAHQYLGQRFRDWPRLPLPAERAELTVFDIAMAGSPEEHADRLRRWAVAVWGTWRFVHDAVVRLIDDRLPVEIRASIRAG